MATWCSSVAVVMGPWLSCFGSARAAGCSLEAWLYVVASAQRDATELSTKKVGANGSEKQEGFLAHPSVPYVLT